MDRINLWKKAGKYRYILAVLLAGILLMLLPVSSEGSPVPEAPQAGPPDMETRLSLILSQIEGAGDVIVMLTEASGEEIFYQTDGEDTVLISDSSRNQEGLVRTRHPPVYRGAIVVCGGADSAAVRLAVVEAVSNVTGLGSDRITVLKME